MRGEERRESTDTGSAMRSLPGGHGFGHLRVWLALPAIIRQRQLAGKDLIHRQCVAIPMDEADAAELGFLRKHIHGHGSNDKGHVRLASEKLPLQTWPALHELYGIFHFVHLCRIGSMRHDRRSIMVGKRNI